MAVPPSETKPNGCPDHSATSTQDCAGPLNNTVCLEFCNKTRKSRTAREMLNSTPSPTNPLEAFAVLLTATAADLEEGKLTTEEAQKLWDDIGNGLKKKS